MRIHNIPRFDKNREWRFGQMIQVYLSISDLSKRFDLRFAHHWYIRTENVAQGIETCQDQDNIPHQTDY